MRYTNNKREKIQKFIINLEIAESLFNECNVKYFNSKLPPVQIDIIDNPKINGDFKYNIDFKNKQLNNFKIEISNNRARTKSKYIATMIHEMAHYLTVLNIPQETINEAIWYYNENNINKFNELLYNDKYAHKNEWLRIINNINMLYNIKINKE